MGTGVFRQGRPSVTSLVASALRRCEYSLDANSWVPVDAADGVIDSQREKFTLDLTNLSPGEHLLVIRAADSAGNPGLAKVILK